MEKHKEIEKSIIKTYRKEIWSPFIKAIKEYNLIEENDHIAICISGGKDSMLLAKLLEELKKHGMFNFKITNIMMDPGYSKKDLDVIQNNFKKLNLEVKIFNTNIFKIVEKEAQREPCYLCARMRRGYLYSFAKELNCNKIALGHHFDDVIETIMLNIFYNGSHQTMMPKILSKNFEKIELIRPLYKIKEKDIQRWQNHNKLEFSACGCSLVKLKNESKRKEIKDLLSELEKINPYIKKNIFKSTENVNIDALLGYKKNQQKYDFYSKK